MNPALNRGQLSDRRLTSHSARYSEHKRRMITPGRCTQPQFGLLRSSTPSHVHAKFSYAAQLNSQNTHCQDTTRPPLPSMNQPPAARTCKVDWLATAFRELQQDLRTTKQEVDLVRDLQQDMDTRFHQSQQQSSLREKPNQKLRENRALIASCREYADSRAQILRERLRQVQFWTASRDMGRKVPEREPKEWVMVDTEWRRWLGEQVAEKTAKADGVRGVPRSPIEDKHDVAWRLWGPLPTMLDCWSWLQEESNQDDCAPR